MVYSFLFVLWSWGYEQCRVLHTTCFWPYTGHFILSFFGHLSLWWNPAFSRGRSKAQARAHPGTLCLPQPPGSLPHVSLWHVLPSQPKRLWHGPLAAAGQRAVVLSIAHLFHLEINAHMGAISEPYSHYTDFPISLQPDMRPGRPHRFGIALATQCKPSGHWVRSHSYQRHNKPPNKLTINYTAYMAKFSEHKPLNYCLLISNAPCCI